MRISENDLAIATAALQTLARLSITAAEISEILNGPEPTEETVRAALDRAESAIDRASEA